MSRYPGSVIDQYSSIEFDEFTLPLGKLKDGVPEKSQHLEGKITRISYAAPAGRSILEVYRNYESALRKAGFAILYECVNNEGCWSGSPTFHTTLGNEDWGWSAGQRYLSAKQSRAEGDVEEMQRMMVEAIKVAKRCAFEPPARFSFGLSVWCSTSFLPA